MPTIAAQVDYINRFVGVWKSGVFIKLALVLISRLKWKMVVSFWVGTESIFPDSSLKTRNTKTILTRSFFDCNFLNLMFILQEYLNLSMVCWVFNVDN